MHPLRRLLRYAGRHRGRVLLAAFYSFLNKVFDLAPPALIGAAIDVVVKREDSLFARLGVVDLDAQLWLLALLTLLVWGLESIFEYAYALAWRGLAQQLQHELRVETYQHVQGLELAFFEDRSSGDLMSVLNDDINQLERFLDGGANDLLQVSTTVVIIGLAFFGMSPTLALLSFVPVPLILWGSFRFQAKIAPRYAEVRADVGRLNAQLANNLGGIATIKGFVSEAREVERFAARSLAYQAKNRDAIRLSSAFSPLIRMAVVIGFIATLIYGGRLTLQGDLEVGLYGVLVFLTQRLLWPLTRLGQTFDLFQRAMASTTRILDLLDTKPQLQDGERVLVPETEGRGCGDIAFADVRFSYSTGGEVLRGLSLVAKAGQTTAIVGSTGAGKSTIVKLLLRLYDVRGGAVTVGGQDVRSLTMASLRQNIAVVSQDVYLFDGTIRDNIAYGRPDATEAQIQRAAELAEIHDYIAGLQDGYDTLVGERGQKLSGGQRQRVSIARAILTDPAVLVLDEATSAVDNETEAAIQRSMVTLAEGRTVIVIAHRLSTVRHADTIYVLERGTVGEQGTHEALVEQNGIYAGLWRVQTGEPTETRASLHSDVA
ncbi:MAG: ABC transporter ATP-binding protein [Myxococcota bacterium]